MNLLLSFLSAVLLLECLEAQKLWSASFQLLGRYESSIFASPQQLRNDYCQSIPQERSVNIYWRSKGQWEQICHFNAYPITERYWKLVATPKIRLSLLGSLEPKMESIILR